jgi:hypothetical protein
VSDTRSREPGALRTVRKLGRQLKHCALTARKGRN